MYVHRIPAGLLPPTPHPLTPAACMGVLIESTPVKDNVSGAAFVMGVVEPLLSLWLH